MACDKATASRSGYVGFSLRPSLTYNLKTSTLVAT